jgi:hypothetical protein
MPTTDRQMLEMSGNTLAVESVGPALINNLAAPATWGDLAYEAQLRTAIAHGLADANSGRVVAVEEWRDGGTPICSSGGRISLGHANIL